MGNILRNFLSLVFGRFTALAIGFVVTVLLARALGVDDYASFIAALGAAELFAAFLELGLTRVLVKEGAADRGRVRGHLANILMIKGGLALLVLAGMHLYAARMGFLTPFYQLALLLCLTKVADSFTMVFDGVFQIFQRMEFSAIILVTGRLCLLAAALAGWKTGAGLLYFGWLYFLISFTTALATVLVAGNRFAWPSRALPLRQTVEREGVFFAISYILFMVNTRLDVVLMREFAPAADTGIYGAMTRLGIAALIVSQTLQTAVFPAMMDLGRNARDRLGAFYGEYLHRALLIALPVLLLFAVFPGAVMRGVFGADFEGGAAWLPLFAIVVLLRFVTLPAGNVLTAVDRQWQRTLGAGIGVALTVGLLFTLLPRMGIAGAIIALLCGEGFMAAFNMLAAARRGFVPAPAPLLRTAMAGVLAAAVLLGIRVWIHPGLILSGILVLLVATAAIWATRAATADELRRALASLKK